MEIETYKALPPSKQLDKAKQILDDYIKLGVLNCLPFPLLMRHAFTPVIGWFTGGAASELGLCFAAAHSQDHR
jgi:hypothetical protein